MGFFELTVILRCDKKSQYRLLKRAILSIWNNPTIFCEVSNRFVGKHMGQGIKTNSLNSLACMSEKDPELYRKVKKFVKSMQKAE